MEKEERLLLLDDSEFVLDTDGNDVPIKQLRMVGGPCSGSCYYDCKDSSDSCGNFCTGQWAPW